MMKKKIMLLGLILALSTGTTGTALADTSNSVSIERCGAYLFEWRPQDSEDGRAFAILAGGTTLYESDVILNRGYDFAYNSDPLHFSRPWGAVPALVNVNGLWGIPSNWSAMPEGSQPTLQIVLKTSYKSTKKTSKASEYQYVDVVYLPGGVDVNSLPKEVRKYIINTDGSDAGAYNDTESAGWITEEDGKKKYRKFDGSFYTNTYITIDDKTYYMDENGYMLSDTYGPDGSYINPSGEKVSYKPGWVSDEKGWRYVQKNGYYAASAWVEDEGKSYYFNMAGYMETNDMTPDGYYVDENGVWDGQASTKVNEKNAGPAAIEGWEQTSEGWKYRKLDKTYLTNSWKETDGKWYYLGANGVMLTDTTTPDGHYVDANGIWVQETKEEVSETVEKKDTEETNAANESETSEQTE